MKSDTETDDSDETEPKPVNKPQKLQTRSSAKKPTDSASSHGHKCLCCYVVVGSAVVVSRVVSGSPDVGSTVVSCSAYSSVEDASFVVPNTSVVHAHEI